MTCREHPLRILRYSMRNIWLLIFPLLRGLSILQMDARRLYEWARGAWQDIAVIGLILLFGFVRWYFAHVTVTDKYITQSVGVIIRYRKTIPLESISVANAERPWLMIPFGGMKFSCDTRAGIFKATDMRLLVTRKVCAELMRHIPDVDRKMRIEDMPRANIVSVVLFSAFFSSGFSGAIFMGMFFLKGGSIAQDIVSLSLSRITETTEKISQRWLLRIPDAAVIFGAFMLAAWLLSFIINLLRYSRFKIIADRRTINVRCGITNRREYRINTSHINYTDLRQNLIMKFLKTVTVNISCAGYGYDSRHLPVLMPIRREKDLGKGLEEAGISGAEKLEFRSGWSGILSYLFNPVLAVNLVLPIYQVFEKQFPRFAELSFFFAVMAEIPLVWLVLVKTFAMLSSGISVKDNKVIVRCAKWTAFHTVIAHKDNIVKAEVRQSLLQMPSKKCNVLIWFCGESSSCYMVRSLKLTEGAEIMKALGYETKTSRASSGDKSVTL
ncbi:MAG: PH domain-containing protein [Ruminococcus sp.]|nr:PH domain-containing protein [Ruminococcus sp.]